MDIMNRYAQLVCVPNINKERVKAKTEQQIPFMPLSDSRKVLTMENEAAIKQLVVAHNIDEYIRTEKDMRLTPLIYVPIDNFNFNVKEVSQCKPSL